MKSKNIAFIGKSLDGFIADKNGSLEWLNTIPNPDNHQMGYGKLMEEIDTVKRSMLSLSSPQAERFSS